MKLGRLLALPVTAAALAVGCGISPERYETDRRKDIATITSLSSAYDQLREQTQDRNKALHDLLARLQDVRYGLAADVLHDNQSQMSARDRELLTYTISIERALRGLLTSQDSTHRARLDALGRELKKDHDTFADAMAKLDEKSTHGRDTLRADLVTRIAALEREHRSDTRRLDADIAAITSTMGEHYQRFDELTRDLRRDLQSNGLDDQHSIAAVNSTLGRLRGSLEEITKEQKELSDTLTAYNADSSKTHRELNARLQAIDGQLQRPPAQGPGPAIPAIPVAPIRPDGPITTNGKNLYLCVLLHDRSGLNLRYVYQPIAYLSQRDLGTALDAQHSYLDRADVRLALNGSITPFPAVRDEAGWQRVNHDHPNAFRAINSDEVHDLLRAGLLKRVKDHQMSDDVLSSREFANYIRGAEHVELYLSARSASDLR